MNTSGHQNRVNNTSCDQIILESLRYDSLFSYQIFEIDNKNNLHIYKRSILKNCKDIIPLDLINPNPICKKSFNKPLMVLAFISILLACISVSLAVIISKLWLMISCTIFFIFGVVTLITSLRNKTTIYEYNFVNTKTPLFSLSNLTNIETQVHLFTNTLNKRIIYLNEKNNKLIAKDKSILKEENCTPLDCNLFYPNEMDIYNKGRKSQYMKHLDFLYNHGIVEEALYERLHLKIDERVNNSNSIFATNTDIEENNMGDNIINFPIKA